MNFNISKNLSNEWHTCRRFRERYGKRLSPREYRELSVLAKSSETLKSMSCARKLKCVQYCGLNILAIYDRKREEIVTVLPPESHVSK